MRGLGEGYGATFRFPRGSSTIEGFVARFQGRVVAYENECRHLPLTLDYGDGQFFSPDQQFFMCRNHGAMFDPRTGLCVRGPCVGASLKPLPVEVRRGVIWLLGEEPLG